ncbi:MAG TPA: glycosyltransferase family 4 protein [Terriglobales bacterium]|nr:glycosyltransferase family 4 protein [Terriglobales bacterium]
MFRAEAEMLRSNGHDVVEYVRCNDEIREYGIWRRLTLGMRTVWAHDSLSDLRRILAHEKPDVVHMHNTFPLISPSAYYACREAGVPVVQTLHNYRLLCAAATLYRDGHVCEDCLTKSAFHGIRHGCYRDSRIATAASEGMVWVHRLLHTWSERVDKFIALTRFSRQKFTENGIAAHKIVVKPNALRLEPHYESNKLGKFVLFVGRLSAEKGLSTLLSAWAQLSNRFPLRILGTGPQRGEIEVVLSQGALSNVRLEGHLSRDATFAAMKEARMLVFPSEWYECFPTTLLESFASGVPVVAARIGAMTEIIDDGRTGLHFNAGDADDLAKKILWAWAHPAEMSAMAEAAYAEYRAKYTSERNYGMLMGIYRSVQCHRRLMQDRRARDGSLASIG